MTGGDEKRPADGPDNQGRPSQEPAEGADDAPPPNEGSPDKGKAE